MAVQTGPLLLQEAAVPSATPACSHLLQTPPLCQGNTVNKHRSPTSCTSDYLSAEAKVKLAYREVLKT